MKNNKNYINSISVGIPAHNEEGNIAYILKDLLAQKDITSQLKEIVVLSDGSSDSTITEIKKVKNNLITILHNKEQQGLSKGLNKITAYVNTDILIILNADTRIKDTSFIKKIIQPLMYREADLTSTRITEILPEKTFEKILYAGMHMKSHIVRGWSKGINVYTCCGLARAFSKKLYKEIVFETSVGEDAFSYFYTITHGFKYKFIDTTEIFYRPSTQYKDHRRQTLRFFQSQKIMRERFGAKFVKQSYRIPFIGMLRGLANSLTHQPIYTTLYLCTIAWSKFLSFFSPEKNLFDHWESAKSSKKLSI